MWLITWELWIVSAFKPRRRAMDFKICYEFGFDDGTDDSVLRKRGQADQEY